MMTQKYTFEHLDQFINQCIYDIQVYESKFHQQNRGMIENLPTVLRNKAKVECLHLKMINMKRLQESIDFTLDFIGLCVYEIESLVTFFGEKWGNDLFNLAPEDPFRDSLYPKIREVSDNLDTCNELLVSLESRVYNYHDAQMTGDSFYGFLKVMNNNLSLMETLWFYIQRLQVSVDCCDQMLVWSGFRRIPVLM